MRFMVMVMSPSDTKPDAMPSEKELIEMGKFNEEMINAGVMLTGEGLRPEKGLAILFKDGNATVKDGPFSEAKEVVGGFWILDVKSQDEVVSWLKRAPFKEGSLQVRRIAEASDFDGIVKTEEGKQTLAAEQAFRDREDAARKQKTAR